MAPRIWPGIKSLLLSFYLDKYFLLKTADLVRCFVCNGCGSEFVLSIGYGLLWDDVFLVVGGQSGNLGE